MRCEHCGQGKVSDETGECATCGAVPSSEDTADRVRAILAGQPTAPDPDVEVDDEPAAEGEASGPAAAKAALHATNAWKAAHADG